MTITYVSAFSGVGGFDYAFDSLGWRPVAQIEFAPFPASVLEKRWKHVRRHGDIRTFVGERGSADVVSGGVPCQDWSVAGKRAGLAGNRSGLFFEFARVVDEIAPRVVIFENVPGLLSACSCGDCGRYRAQQRLRLHRNADDGDLVDHDPETEDRVSGGVLPGHRGSDFAIVLRELTGFWPIPPQDGWNTGGVCTGSKRTAAWRVLDSRHFGVPQRRRRLFLVAGAGAEHALSILADAEGGAWHPAPGIAAGEDAAAEAGEGLAGTLGASGHTGRSRPDDLDGHGAFVPEGQESFRMRGFGDYEGDGAASALKKRDHKDATDLIVASTVTSGGRETGPHGALDGVNLVEDVAGTVRSHPRPGSNDVGGIVASTPSGEGDVSPTFRAHYGKDWNDPSNPSGPLVVGQEQVVPPLTAQHGGPSHKGWAPVNEADHLVTVDAPEKAHSLRAQKQMAHRDDVDTLVEVTAPDVASPLTHGSFDKSHTPGRRREDDTNIVAIEAVGRKMSGGPEVGKGFREDGTMFTLDTESKHAVMIPEPEDPMMFKAGHYTGGRGTGGKAQNDEAPALTSQARGGSAEPLVVQPLADDQDIAHTLRATGFDASEDGTGRGTPLVIRAESDKPLAMYGHSGLNQKVQEDISPPITRGSTLDDVSNPPIVLTDQRGRNQGERALTDETFTLHAAKGPSEQQIVSVEPPVVMEPRFARNGRGGPEAVVPPLKAQSGQTGKGDSAPIVIQDARDIDKDQHGMGASEGPDAYTVDTTGAQGVMTPVDLQNLREGHDDETGTIDTSRPSRGGGQAIMDAASVSENQRAEVRETPQARQLVTGGGKPGSGYAAARVGAAVRRLTPTETERLQAFPDGWTCLEVEFQGGVGRFPDGEPYSTARCKCPDGPRYAAMGNAVTVNVVRWVAECVDGALRA